MKRYQPSKEFKRQKQWGQYFQNLVVPHLLEMGMRVIDTDGWRYRQKRGVDLMVVFKGQRCGLELKLDRMSETTSRVCVDIDSLNKTTSSIWIYGLPHGSQIDCYATQTSDFKPFVQRYSIQRPYSLQKVGEFKDKISKYKDQTSEAVLIPKSVFINQPFVKKWRTINTN